MKTPVPFELTKLTRPAQLYHRTTLYGLQYPGIGGCRSWCYLTVYENKADVIGVIIASQLDGNMGTSITNIWSYDFIKTIRALPEIKGKAALEGLRWFEHYDHKPPVHLVGLLSQPTIDEVFITPDEKVGWVEVASDERQGAGSVAAMWTKLVGGSIPDFAATGFEQKMTEG
jgi:hypothetical protein